MKINRNVIFAIMTTFCLTSIVFMVIPIRSANSPYDPWIDYNDDGKISLSDLTSLANTYGTTGDPTKNVTVTNLHDYDIQIVHTNFSSQGLSVGPPIFCGGYSRLSIVSCELINVSIGASNSITIYVAAIGWFYAGTGIDSSYESLSSNDFNITILSDTSSLLLGHGPSASFITETKGPRCALYPDRIIPSGVSLPANWCVALDYTVYLRNE